MPDFGQDLQPIIKTDSPSPFTLDVAAPKKAGRPPIVPASTPNLSNNGDVFAMLDQATHNSNFDDKGVFVTNATLDANRRYRTYNPTISDQEDFVAYGQSEWDKAANGVLKGANLAATTIAGGFGMLAGVSKSVFTGRFADIWDNPILNALDQWNEKVDQEYLPNYYSNKESNANWYSTDNWFTTNFLFDKLIKNSGFAVGAMVSGNWANTFLLGTGALAGELATSAALAAESSQAFKLFTPLLKNTARAFSAGKNIEAAQALENGISSIADLTSKSKDIAKIANQANQFFKINDVGRRTAVALYSSAGEATFEALQTAKEFKNNLIAEYTQTNGVAPTGDELKRIEEVSESVGKTSFLGNMALLTVTEYSQLPYILGSSYKNTRQAANTFLKGTDEIVLEGGKYAAKRSTKLASATGLTKYIFDPKEAAQELGQYALQIGSQNYYNKAYQSNDADAWVDGFMYGFTGTNKRGEDVGALNSKGGMESLLLGGLTGGLMQTRGRIQETKSNARTTQEFVSLLNNSPTFKEAFQDRLNSANRGVVLQQEYENAVKQGDRLEATDAKTDLSYNYISNKVKYGRFDMIMQDLQDLRTESSSEEGLAALKQQGIGAITDTVSSFQQRLIEFENLAKDVNILNESLNLRYGANPNFTPAVIDKMVYAATKIANYDKRIPLLKSNLSSKGINVDPVLVSSIEGGQIRYKEAEQAINKLDSIDKDELKQELKDVRELAIRRESFVNEFNKIKKSPKDYQDIAPKTPEVISEETEALRKDFSEGRNYQTSTELQQASVHELSEDEFQVKIGNVVVDNFPTKEEAESERDNLNTYHAGLSKVRIIKINDEGSAKVESFTGEIFTLSPKELRQYELLETEEEKQARLEVEKLEADKEFLQKIKGTFTKDPHINDSVGEFEPVAKKSDYNVVNGTIPVDDGKPHQQRANTFGINYAKLENKDKFKIVEITAKTEIQAGIPGLIDHLIAGTDIDRNTVVVAAVVEERPDGSFVFINENGQVIGNNLLNAAIYQVRPTEKLANSEGSMFRATTPDAIKEELTKRYAAERKRVLESSTLQPLKGLFVSFGIPVQSKIVKPDGKEVNNLSAQNVILETELITEEQLATQHVITVATTNDLIAEGTTSFKNALGRVFLRVPGAGLVKLNTSKLGKKKAETVFSVIQKISSNISEDPKNGVKKSESLFNWLKSTIYWGIPKDLQTGDRKEPSYNSVWFEEVEGISVLFVGKTGRHYTFTPTNLERDKAEIISVLENLYHNVSATDIHPDKPLAPYNEILGFNKEGEAITEKWDNYQTYLISSKGRKNEEIPLTTTVAPVIGTDKQNREAIYFILQDSVDTQIQPKQETKKPTPTPKPEAKPASNVSTVNIPKIAGVEIGDIPFIREGNNITFPTEEGLVTNQNILKAVKALQDKLNITPEEAQEKLASLIVTLDKPKEAPKVEPTPEGPKPKKLFGKVPNAGRDTATRLLTLKEFRSNRTENWPEVEKWLMANFPNIPVYRVKNVIDAGNGRQAWGMLHNGAIYLQETAEVGTVYHEVFEAVWKMFSGAKEQYDILKEFKDRKGSFTNRFTGQVTNYSEASYLDAKEQLAEEFRDYILYKKSPIKPEGRSFIQRLFKDIVNFIKTFFTGFDYSSNTANLFSKIGNGYYAQYVPHEFPLSFAKVGVIDIPNAQGDLGSEYRIKNIPYSQVHELMQQMTYSTLGGLIRNNESLFNLESSDFNKTDLYKRLKDELLYGVNDKPSIIENMVGYYQDMYDAGEITKQQLEQKELEYGLLWDSIENEWSDLVDKHTEYLKTYSITFDENDEITVNDENKDKGNDGYEDARKVDTFRKANPAIKLLFGTLPELEYFNDQLVVKRSNIGGAVPMAFDKVFITLKNKLYDSLNVEEMLTRLGEFSKTNPNYSTLYTRLTKSSPGETVDFSKLQNDYDLQLISAFWKTMKAQNADVKIVFILPSGEVEISDAHLSDATRQIKYEMFNSVVAKLKDKTDYFKYDKKEKSYSATDKLKKIKLNPSNIDSYISFLSGVGIDFTKEEVGKFSPNQKRTFITATEGVLSSLSKIEDVKQLDKRTIDLEKRLTQLASVKAASTNPDFESVYFNINGEKTQTYIGTNVVSNLYDQLKSLKKKSDLSNTPYSYLLTDSFSQRSQVLQNIFSKDTRKENTEDILSTGILEGIVDQTTGKSKDSSQVTQKERVIQELNLNYKGWFLNLVPGDASIEWMVKMYHDNNPFVNLANNYNDLYTVFKDYFIDEVNVSREDRDIVETGGRKSTDLRFFKAILDSETHNSIVKDRTKTPDVLYLEHKTTIDKALKSFVENKAELRLEQLEKYGIVSYVEGELVVEDLAFAEEGISKEYLNKELQQLEANYIVANIELHKLIYSDPYFYKDELKRIKNFNSPGQPLLSSPKINEALSRVYNKGFKKKDFGYTDFVRGTLVSSVISDVFSTNELPGYSPFEETDGGGYVTLKAARNIRIRSSNWTENDEAQYRHDIKYEQLFKEGATQAEIEEFDKKNNPDVKSTYTDLKPIVRGNKEDGESFNDVVLDKFALMPLSFRILHKLNPESNAIKHYQKMMDEGVDYTVYNSGRKVGAGETTPLYTEEGTYNPAPFAEKNNISFHILDIQTDVPSKDDNQVTQGSQVTKLATMDFMDAGVPIDFESTGKFEDRYSSWIQLSESQKLKTSSLYKEIKNNETLLIEKIRHGYDVLLNRLGIIKENGRFIISDNQKLSDTLQDEILKRESNDNIIDAFAGFRTGDVVLEATPAYQQIRNILYSIANKQVVRPKISGGQKVQVPSTLLESVRAKKEGKSYTSDVLAFYQDEDGKRVCEVMVGRWFDSDKTDEELLNYLNKTKEGQSILGGLGFRIPTQKQNSIDVFKIKQFLPREFGDSVVVPSALVKKVGSDFDIDKLSVYLKNTYTDLKDNTKLIPFFGYGQQAKDKFIQMYEEGNFLTSKQRATAAKWIKNRKIEDKDEATDNLFTAIFGLKGYDEAYEQEVIDDLLSSENVEQFKERMLDLLYKQSLENEYIQSMENLTSNPLNFKRLTTPNSADQLKDLSKEIVKLLGEEQVDYTSTATLLDRGTMSSLRQAFVRGKYAIGIAATSQTNNAQNQRALIYIDLEKLAIQSEDDQKWLGDGVIKFQEFNKMTLGDKKVTTLSLAKNAKGEYISDIVGQFIDGYVDISKGPWIMEMGATPNTAPTWLFLIKIGVPVETVGYFMNQPIVRDYLQTLENSGYTWLFNTTTQAEVEGKYKTNVKVSEKQLPSSTTLKGMIGADKLTDKQKAEQLFILKEFFKYAKLSEHLFHVQQGSNFDTATLNDPFLMFKKELQLEKARTTMISSVDKILESSFVGELEKTLANIRDAFSTILISDRDTQNGGMSVRDVMETTLRPYINLNDRDFVKLSQKAVSDLFDWAVQTNGTLSAKLQSVLLGTENRKSAAEQVTEFIKSVKSDENHPLYGNYIVNALKEQFGSKENTPQNLYLAGKGNKAYDQNQVIYGFEELRKHLASMDKLQLYQKLVDLAVLQSGLSNSRISFTQLLPYEDFKNIYNEVLFNLDKMTNLKAFVDLNVFERNNWSNDDIVAFKRSKWLKLTTPFIDPFSGMEKKWIKVPEIDLLDKKLKKAINDKKVPQLIQISTFGKDGRSEFITFSWEKDISAEKKKQMRKKGDYSFINKGLFKKTYSEEGEPLTTTYISKKNPDKVYTSYIYKPVNAWGDSFRANEFYNIPQQSIIDNGFLKVETEVDDSVIENILYPKKQVTKQEGGSSQIPECL